VGPAILLPQLARIRRGLEEDPAPAIEIVGWPGSGVERLADCLVETMGGRCRWWLAESAQAEPTVEPSILQHAVDEVCWWVLPGRPPDRFLGAFRRQATDHHRLIWTSHRGDHVARRQFQRWPPQRLLLSAPEILELSRRQGEVLLSTAEALSLRRLTDGWLEPLRRILEASARRRLPTSAEAAIAIDPVREFFSEELLKDLAPATLRALRFFSAMRTVPLAFVRGEQGSVDAAVGVDREWLDEGFLVPARGGGWRVPRLLGAALAAMPPGAEEEWDDESLTAATTALRRSAPEAVSGLWRVQVRGETARDRLAAQWLEVLCTEPMSAIRSGLGDGTVIDELEPAGGDALLAGLLAALDRPTAGAESSRALDRLAWRVEEATLAAIADLCARLLRVIGGDQRPTSGLDPGGIEREWPLALRGLLQLHELAAGLDRLGNRGDRLEEVWECLELDSLPPEGAQATLPQELGLRVIASLVAGESELRRRFELRLASGGESLRRRFAVWMDPTGTNGTRYQVHLLGRARVDRCSAQGEEEHLEGSLHREILLLARLATGGDSGATREELKAVVWPGRSEAFFERNLHPTVSRLRSTLRSDGADPDPIVVRQSLYRLAPDYAWQVDVQEFLDAISSAAEARRQGRHAAESHWLERADGLYGGEFLSGFDEPWVTHMRERLSGYRAGVSHRLADLLWAGGEPTRSVDLMRRLLAENPSDEQAHRRLMELYRSTGRRDLVLRQYERLVAELEAFGAAPDEATAALFRDLMR